MIWGYHYFWKHPYTSSELAQVGQQFDLKQLPLRTGPKPYLYVNFRAWRAQHAVGAMEANGGDIFSFDGMVKLFPF